MSRATYEAFYQHQKLLFGIAYRMVGTITDAEDIVQDVLIDWYPKVEQGLEIECQRAYLASMVTRKSIDHLRHAYVQRELYFGPWLPEPLVVGDAGEHTDPLILNDNISMAWMLLLERLSPLERAIYVLREAFDFDYETISRCVGKQVAYCRKIMQRAKERVVKDRPQFDVSDEQHRVMVQEFLDAANTGDIHKLLDMLIADSTLVSDGGGRISAPTRPVYGAENIAYFLLGIRRKAPASIKIDYQIATINGDYGILASVGSTILYAMSFCFQGDKIAMIYNVRNPDKLAHIPRQENPVSV